MRRSLRHTLAFLLAGSLLCLADPAAAQQDHVPAGYPHSLETELRTLLESSHDGRAADAGFFIRLAELYMNLADDLYTDPDRRRSAYEEGAKAAERAMTLHDHDAQAHFLFAANLGSAARLKGLAAGPAVLSDIKAHLRRALDVQPDHAPSLQMMGGLLAELPWFLGGDERKAEDYLRRAIASDGNYTNARMLLAKLLTRQGRYEEARRQLEAVIHADRPHYPYTWARRFRPEAEHLLHDLENPSVKNDRP